MRARHLAVLAITVSLWLPAPAAANTDTPTVCGGGALPPCWVLDRENPHHDPRVWNGGCHAPVGWRYKSPCGSSSASGWLQIVRRTWGGFAGYLNAADAPLRVQLTHARRLWNHGKGCKHWGTRACTHRT